MENQLEQVKYVIVDNKYVIHPSLIKEVLKWQNLELIQIWFSMRMENQ
jgi:hypothetical protein